MSKIQKEDSNRSNFKLDDIIKSINSQIKYEKNCFDINGTDELLFHHILNQQKEKHNKDFLC